MVASERRKWLALALLSVVQFMVVLDIAIVNVALPSIQVDLGFSQENLQWVISAYALVFGGFLLLGGRSADLLGRRRIFMLGTILFTVGSLLCGLAWSEESLIAFRALQGLGAATITPAALSILVATFAEIDVVHTWLMQKAAPGVYQIGDDHARSWIDNGLPVGGGRPYFAARIVDQRGVGISSARK